MIPYSISRGETLSLVVEATAGDPLLVSGVAAKMKPIPFGRMTPMPGDEVAVSATFTVTALPAVTGFRGGWEFSLSAVETEALAAGYYLIDASFTIGGITVIDGPVMLEVQNSAVAA